MNKVVNANTRFHRSNGLQLTKKLLLQVITAALLLLFLMIIARVDVTDLLSVGRSDLL